MIYTTIIEQVLLCVREAKFVILSNEVKLRVSENKILRKMLGPVKDIKENGVRQHVEIIDCNNQFDTMKTLKSGRGAFDKHTGRFYSF